LPTILSIPCLRLRRPSQIIRPMNAVEIEEAVSNLAAAPFDAAEFPFAFLQAFDNKETTLRKLRSGATNSSDLGGVLQRNNIHIAVCPPGDVSKTLAALKASPATAKAKARFVLATDGIDFEAENLESTDAPLVCTYEDFPDHFGFFLPLAGITTVRQIAENSFDIRATSRLNKLYVELLRENPDWGTADRRHDMNHFMARLIFCFFAEDTDIFHNSGLFTATVEQMSARDSSNTHEVIGEIFRAMNTKVKDRNSAAIKSWADGFPYVNGGLFSGSLDVPRFTKIARSFLLNVGKLDWKRINPDIFGSMIQAVAEDEERGALGLHYTSVPNIQKVLNPLFLDDLRAQLEEAKTNGRKLLNLRNRMAKVRVFDPACGSGNFLVIAYKQMREIEADINVRRGEASRRSDIPLTNFRGIELRDFPAEIARLALIIAEYQCDVLYRGQKEALAEFLPLNAENWITCGNALRLDWLSICPPTGTGVKYHADDLLHTPLDQTQIDFENAGGETYICGNPPYRGFTWQTAEQKSELQAIFGRCTSSWKSLDYVAGWFLKAADYGTQTLAVAAFVSTNSICQGEQVPILWPLIFRRGYEIAFAHTSFKWANLASHNAGVTVAVIGISNHPNRLRRLYSVSDDGSVVKEAEHINAYLVPGPNVIVEAASRAPEGRAPLVWGNKPSDGGNLIMSVSEADEAVRQEPFLSKFIFDFVGSQEFVRGIVRKCIWIDDGDADEALSSRTIADRVAAVRAMRLASAAASTQEYAEKAHRFRQIQGRSRKHSIVVPKVTSESRPYLPVGLLTSHSIISDNAFALYDAPLWNMALIASRLHLVWIATVCGKLKTDFRYSNTLGWNTFPRAGLTDTNKADLTRCAEDILLAREAHFPATIADLYDPENMPADLRAAHDRNDEVMERIYIGRRFRNDTERLEKLFELYTKMTAGTQNGRNRATKRGQSENA
jgi:restriction-modification enzyme MmeI-like protein